MGTTGKLWTGPSGGDWVELDAAAEKPGWLPVEGPGFNMPGPLLEKVEPSEEAPLVLKLYSLITKSVLCEICVKKGASMRVIKWWVALRDPHKLKPAKVLLAINMPSDTDQGSFSISSFPTSNLANDEAKVDQVYEDGAQVPYFYMGESSDDGA